MRVMQHKNYKKSKWRRCHHVKSTFSIVNWFPRRHLWYTQRINDPRNSTISPKTRYPSYGWRVKSKIYHENLRSGIANLIATRSKGNTLKQWFWYRRHRSKRARTRPVHMPWIIGLTSLLDDEMCENVDGSSPCLVFQSYINTTF